MPAQPVVIGLDLGTSGVKAVLMDAEGRILADTQVSLSLQILHPGWSEQSPQAWTAAVVEAMKLLTQREPEAAMRVEAIATSGQMHGAVLLSSDGSPLRPAILWNDQRSMVECRQMTERVGAERLISLAGNKALAGFTAPKILWVRNHEPDVHRRIHTVLLPKDYLNYALTDTFASEPSDASGTLLFDVVNREWSAELARAVGLAVDQLPPVGPSAGRVGILTDQMAVATGLRSGIPVVAGGADNACAALGLGIVDEGDLMVSIGTSGTVVAATPSPRIEPEARLHTFCHVTPDQWYSMGVVLSAGSSLHWFRDAIWPPGWSGDGYSEIASAAAESPIGANGLIFLPYLTGERTPHGDGNARGAFVGLSLSHDRADLARAVFEGISFAINDSVELIDKLGSRGQNVRMTGGGARSEFWRQMLADILGRPIWTASDDLGPAYGAALLAAAGVGLISSAADGARKFVKPEPVAQPDETAMKQYRRQYEIYRSGYPALADIYEHLASLRAPDHSAKKDS